MSTVRTYLDYNATAPLLDEARTAMSAALDAGGNASSVHGEGRAARAMVELARTQVAAVANADKANVVFTSGATEAANTLLTPRWRMGRSLLRVSKLYVSATDHPCLLSGGRFDDSDIVILPVAESGLLDLDALENALADHDREAGMALVAIHAANNETGVIQPLARIGEIARRHGALLVVDAVQAAGRISLDIGAGCGDFLILSSHKIGGPQGAGAIIARGTAMMPAPLLAGGGQEKGFRAGTENVAAIAGFGAAAAAALAGLPEFETVTKRRDEIEARIRHMLPDTVFHGADVVRIGNTVCFAIPGMKAETAQIAFDLAGIAVSAGSACSSGKLGESHVLKAMGAVHADQSLRVSIGHATTDEDVARFSAALEKIALKRAARPAAA